MSRQSGGVGVPYYDDGDADGYCAQYAEDVVLSTPDGRFEGRQAARQYVQAQFTAFPDGGL